MTVTPPLPLSPWDVKKVRLFGHWGSTKIWENWLAKLFNEQIMNKIEPIKKALKKEPIWLTALIFIEIIHQLLRPGQLERVAKPRAFKHLCSWIWCFKIYSSKEISLRILILWGKSVQGFLSYDRTYQQTNKDYYFLYSVEGNVINIMKTTIDFNFDLYHALNSMNTQKQENKENPSSKKDYLNCL